ncbi:MAG TPA: MarR family transcriptional regulator [Candidatus Baltobacteraceae bacterium]|nr:MarR family transcriptional regulator [Candidatus Baltobacteraceae bacterium]
MSSKISLQAAEALHSGAIRVLRLVRTEDAQAGIGPAQLSALSVLVFAGEKTVGELATLEQVQPPTMSRIVDGLVQKKLVERVSSANDRRTVQISATPAGRKLLLAGRDRRVRALAKRFDDLSKKEVETLLAAAEIMKRI